MNIKEAKTEVENAVKAYLIKDKYGKYKIDRVRQRPVLGIGAPGKGNGNRSYLIFNDTPYKAKCHRSAVHRKKDLRRKRIYCFGIHNE